ncbi:MAG: RHS repeat-associated core domain-containing protein [Proteobacteria bacterium]|nr:MAG: RHS repeat-associated core domain-containing protein [Pseudomonadota bacterium]
MKAMKNKTRLFASVSLLALAAVSIISYQNLAPVVNDQTTVQIKYFYDRDGNVVNILDNVRGSLVQTFTYDGLARVTSARFPNAGPLLPAGRTNLGGDITYSKSGNITSYTEFGAPSTKLNYHPTLNVLASTSGSEARAFSYNQYGAVTSDGVRSFGYDNNQNLISSGPINSAPTVYNTYDAEDFRVKKVNTNGKTTYFVYVGGKILYETTQSPAETVAKEYFYANTNLIGTRKLTACASCPTPSIEYAYHHSNPVASTIALSNESGALTRERYNIYGRSVTLSNNLPTQTAFKKGTDVRYAGHVSDDETGLIYMNSRFYDPAVGRFMSMDIDSFSDSNMQSFNRYAYANNNPNKFVDPDGKNPVVAAGVVVLEVAALGYTVYDTYQTYQEKGAGAAVKTFATSAALTLTPIGMYKAAPRVAAQLAAWRAARAAGIAARAAERGVAQLTRNEKAFKLLNGDGMRFALKDIKDGDTFHAIKSELDNGESVIAMLKDGPRNGGHASLNTVLQGEPTHRSASALGTIRFSRAVDGKWSVEISGRARQTNNMGQDRLKDFIQKNTDIEVTHTTPGSLTQRF